MMQVHLRMILLVIALWALAALACSGHSARPVSQAVTPTATVVISQDAARQMQRKIDQAAAQAKTGAQFQVTLTESELTSYVDDYLKRAQVQGDHMPFANLRIRLTQGQMWASGLFVFGTSQVSGQMVVLPQVQGGQLSVKIVKADFGSFPVPAALLDQLNQQIQKSLDKQSSQNITLTGLTIREGEMTVTGKGRK
jgi:uncharacterized protein YpmS